MFLITDFLTRDGSMVAHTKISVVYQSNSGHTRRIAEAFKDGAQSVKDTEVHQLEIVGSDVREGRWSNDRANLKG